MMQDGAQRRLADTASYVILSTGRTDRTELEIMPVAGGPTTLWHPATSI